MNHSQELESYGPGHRTFDCPWCGAISGIDPSHIGEQFECPECHRATKLTPKNARPRQLTDPPKQAPHHEDGWLTFDCPWCGAISQVGASLLGTAYDCPECKQSTRLTDQTTRPGDLQTRVEDAPRHEESHTRLAMMLAAILVVAALGWFAFGRGGDADDEGTNPVRTLPPTAEGPETEPEVPVEEPVAPAVEEPTEVVPDEGAELLAAAKTRIEKAVGALDTAEANLQVWLMNNPLLKEVLREQQARVDLQDGIQKGIAAIETMTPQALRELNVKIRAFAAEDSARVLVIEQMLTALRRDPFRPVSAASWEELNLVSPRFREMLEHRILEGRQVIPEEHIALRRAVADAKQERQAAEEGLLALGE